MPKHTRGIRKHGARVLLSDVLPYELPPSFNNRGFYNFVQQNGMHVTSTGPSPLRGDDITRTLMAVAFGRKVRLQPTASNGSELVATGPDHPIPTIPFQFTVQHRANDFRTLTIPHPAAQLDIVNFYEGNADLILYHTAKSDFSLRRPSRVARYSVVRDWLFGRNRREHLDTVEEDLREYEWLRSYFAYEQYSNIYKFFESNQYRACERRFAYLVKVDVAKCFDSIYTHSIAWAAEGHDVVKAHVTRPRGQKPKKGREPFGDDFDKLMQRLNQNETSGITIGSEVSRIFAEIILQAVDVDVQAALALEGLSFGVDYEILRYVDDYFVFLADAHRRQLVVATLSEKLRKYKLHLNASKEQGEHTPWLSPLSVAKSRLVGLVREHVHSGEAQPDSAKELPDPFVQTASLIVGYKAILQDTGVSHFDLANYALLQCERQLERLLRSSRDHLERLSTNVREVRTHTSHLASALLYLLDFAFFVYSGAPRMSPAVKIARIVSTTLRFSRETGVAAHDRERLEMRIRSELVQQLRRSSRSEAPGVVTATLLDCLSDLGDRYRCTEDELAEWCRFEADDDSLTAPGSMNALLLFSLLLHIKDRRDYRRLRNACMSWALDTQKRAETDAERGLIALNLLACPWAPLTVRTSILNAYGFVATASTPGGRQPAYWNINWSGFDLYDALQSKRLYEVY